MDASNFFGQTPVRSGIVVAHDHEWEGPTSRARGRDERSEGPGADWRLAGTVRVEYDSYRMFGSSRPSPLFLSRAFR